MHQYPVIPKLAEVKFKEFKVEAVRRALKMWCFWLWLWFKIVSQSQNLKELWKCKPFELLDKMVIKSVILLVYSGS